MDTREILPSGWKQALEQTLDFDAAYDSLAGYDHFYSYAIKGNLRHYQGRFGEALEEFERAENRFASAPPTQENRRLFGLLLCSRLSTRSWLEVRDPDPLQMAVTDRELDRMLAVTDPDSTDRFKGLGLYNLLRGNYEESLKLFESVIQVNRASPERCVASYICAAASAHEIGLYKCSRRHYENAELTMSAYCNRVVFSICLTWLLALSNHWGWTGEANRWTETIRVLNCPESTRRSLFERAADLQEASAARIAVVFA